MWKVKSCVQRRSSYLTKALGDAATGRVPHAESLATVAVKSALSNVERFRPGCSYSLARPKQFECAVDARQTHHYLAGSRRVFKVAAQAPVPAKPPKRVRVRYGNRKVSLLPAGLK